MFRICRKILMSTGKGSPSLRILPPKVGAFSTMHDPPYLDDLKPPIDLCPAINVQITGPDFALVESYQKVVHRIARMIDIDVSDCWGMPPKKTKVTKFKPSSTVVECEYLLTHYERNVQIVDLPNNLAPILIELLQAATPPTVSVKVKHHTDQDDIDRYVPDMELKQLKEELVAAGGPAKKR